VRITLSAFHGNHPQSYGASVIVRYDSFENYEIWTEIGKYIAKLNFLQCMCAKIYENWLKVQKVIAVVKSVACFFTN